MLTFMRQSLCTVVDALRKELGWIATNLVTMLAPILFECWLELPRSEWDAPNGIDVIGTWILKVLPFLAAIFIVNIIWLTQIWRRNRELARRRAFGTWLLVCCLWLVPLCLNNLFFGLLAELIRMFDGEAWHH